MLFVETFSVGAFACNCSVIACPQTKQAIIVDPGGDAHRIAQIVRHYDVSVRSIVHTHAHLDHIYATQEVKQMHGGQLCLHRADLPLYDAHAMQCQMFGWEVKGVDPIDRFIEDGDTVSFGESSALVIHTPGHTPGSICFEVQDGNSTIVFAGDTLFRGSVGRTDLPGGDFGQIETSIRQRLYTLSPDAQVIPGHGPHTTIGDEIRGNAFVSGQ